MINIPSVIRVNRYVNFFRNNTILNRANVLIRDDYTCQYCSKKSNNMTIDHIIPKNRGGEDTWDNLVAACGKCNTRKGDYLLDKIEMHLLKKPKKPNYLFYFKQYITKDVEETWKNYLYMKN
jgi:5-methylcytosine-specific restriction endonuclease McrA